jgi:hypothetical protein
MWAVDYRNWDKQIEDFQAYYLFLPHLCGQVQVINFFYSIHLYFHRPDIRKEAVFPE